MALREIASRKGKSTVRRDSLEIICIIFFNEIKHSTLGRRIFVRYDNKRVTLLNRG